MRFLENKYFENQSEDYGLSESYLKDVLNNVFEGRSESLGSKLYKIRAKGRSKGKSGGFRNIFFWKKGEIIIFCYIFPKNEKDNLSKKDLKGLRILSKEYASLTDKEIEEMISHKNLKEVGYEEKQ